MSEPVYTFDMQGDLRLPGWGTFEACPGALRALNAAWGWHSDDAPVPAGLRDATYQARATHRVTVRVTLTRDGTLSFDQPRSAVENLRVALLALRDDRIGDTKLWIERAIEALET